MEQHSVSDRVLDTSGLRKSIPNTTPRTFGAFDNRALKVEVLRTLAPVELPVSVQFRDLVHLHFPPYRREKGRPSMCSRIVHTQTGHKKSRGITRRQSAKYRVLRSS